MKYSSRVEEALRLAAKLHRNQTRKDKDKTPYITHLVAVATMVSEVTDNEDVIVAGLMHDCLEDVPNYTYENLVSDCGEGVAKIVKGVTEEREYSPSSDKELRWLKTKENYLENLRNGSKESIIVSCADKTHNLLTLISDFKIEGEQLLKKFSASPKNTLWFNNEILKIFSLHIETNNIILQKFNTALNEANTIFSNYETN